jgi:hypothetical protein
MCNMTELRSYTKEQETMDARRYAASGDYLGESVRPRGTGRYGTVRRDSYSHRSFTDTLSEAVQANPMSAALIGMGVLWLFAGGSNTSLFGGGNRRSLLGPAAHGVRNMGSAAAETGTRAVSSVAGSLRNAAQSASAAASQLADTVADSSTRIASTAGDAFSSAFDTSKTAASRAADVGAAGGAYLQESAGQWVSTVRHGLADAIEQQPLWLGAIGLVIGAGMAASVPATDFEKKVIGDAGEAVKDQLVQAASQAREVAEAVTKEAEAQGLAPSGTAHAVRNLGETVTQKTKELLSGEAAGTRSQTPSRNR